MATNRQPTAGTLHLDQDVKVKLTVKKGPKSGNPRNKDGYTTSIKLSQGFDVFKATILAFRQKPEFSGARLLSEEMYFKKAKNTPQSAYVLLSEQNFLSLFQARWSYIQAKEVEEWSGQNLTPQQAFEFEVFVYVHKNTSGSASSAPGTLRRATAARVQEAAARLQEHLEETGTNMGQIARQHATMQLARRTTDQPVELPTDNTFRQAQHLDQMNELVREREEQERERPAFRNVRMRLNGTEVEVPVELRSLREALGLPNYPLFRDGIFHEYQHPNLPAAQDAPDVDHMTEQELENTREV